jgi:hypothetical protein
MSTPTAAHITAEALATPPAKPHPRHFMEALRILHEEKLMTFPEISAWFKKRELPFSQSGIWGAYQQHLGAQVDARAEAAKQKAGAH